MKDDKFKAELYSELEPMILSEDRYSLFKLSTKPWPRYILTGLPKETQQSFELLCSLVNHRHLTAKILLSSDISLLSIITKQNINIFDLALIQHNYEVIDYIIDSPNAATTNSKQQYAASIAYWRRDLDLLEHLVSRGLPLNTKINLSNAGDVSGISLYKLLQNEKNLVPCKLFQQSLAYQNKAIAYNIETYSYYLNHMDKVSPVVMLSSNKACHQLYLNMYLYKKIYRTLDKLFINAYQQVAFNAKNDLNLLTAELLKDQTIKLKNLVDSVENHLYVFHAVVQELWKHAVYKYSSPVAVVEPTINIMSAHQPVISLDIDPDLLGISESTDISGETTSDELLL